LNLAGDNLAYGTAGFALTAHDATSGHPSPAFVGGFGVESAGSGNRSTRLEYLYLYDAEVGSAHVVRAALLLSIK
jgi:hypothetical protein